MEEHMEHEIPSTTQIKNFRENVVWRSIVTQIEEMRDETINELLSEDESIGMYRRQGEIKGHEDILSILDVLEGMAIENEERKDG